MDKGADAMLATYTVTPMGPPDGKEVECAITGPNVIDEAIFLDLNQGYDLTFELAPGTYTFDLNKPFCNQSGKCPPAKGGSAHSPYSVTSRSATTITVHCDPVHAKAVSHYRLNFANDFTCDPIIIHD
jgi:hypothetical protein